MSDDNIEQQKERFEDSGWPVVVNGAFSRAYTLAQNQPEKYKDGLRIAWNSLPSMIKKDISEEIGDEEKEERFFDELIQEVLKKDLKNEFSDETPKQRKIVRCCEYINNVMIKMLEKRGWINVSKSMPSFGMRKRIKRGSNKQ